MQMLRRKLTYANVIATLALFIAIGGASAFAASQLAKNSVGTKQLKKNSVTAAKIKNGAVTGAKINLSTVGKVPSASTADTAAEAGTLQGKAASAFMQGGGQFFSARRELGLGASNVPFLSLPGLGSVTATCQAGTTFPRGGFTFVNNSGLTMEETVHAKGGADGTTAVNGKSVGLALSEYVGAWTVQLATRSPQPIVATLDLSFLKTDAENGCNMIGQATLAGG